MTKTLSVWISRALVPFKKLLSFPTPWGMGRGWFPIINEPYPGAWQQNRSCSPEDVLAFAIVWRCVQLISSDIAKLPLNLIKEAQDDIWVPHRNTAHTPLLREPNHFQTRIQFVETWVLSLLLHGNTYVLKQRDARGVVSRLYVLDPSRVKVLVSDDGAVFYELSTDNLVGRLGDTPIRVPASEIIHDRMTPAYHPLIGISPLRAATLAAANGLRIHGLSTTQFENGAMPSGILTAAGIIPNEQAKEIQDAWQAGFSGNNRGKVAVLGADLKYTPLENMNASDAQLVEQLRLSAEFVCIAFGVPPFKVGLGQPPAYGNVQALNVQYYTDCLQKPIESIEALLDKGLDLPNNIGVEFDTDALLRMDTATLVEAANKAISSGMSPNEGRKKFFGLGPVKGGETPFMQQQMWPLKDLANRQPPDLAPTAPDVPKPPTAPSDDDEIRSLPALSLLAKALAVTKLEKAA